MELHNEGFIGYVDNVILWIQDMKDLCCGEQMFAAKNESIQIHNGTLMKKITLLKTDVMIGVAGIFVFLGLSFGFGYFFGQYEQIELNKSGLQVMPDVNCRLESEVDAL